MGVGTTKKQDQKICDLSRKQEEPGFKPKIISMSTFFYNKIWPKSKQKLSTGLVKNLFPKDQSAKELCMILRLFTCLQRITSLYSLIS